MKLTKKQKKIYNWLLSKPGYLKKSVDYLFNNYTKGLTDWNEYTDNDVIVALKQARIDYKIHQEDTKAPNKIVLKSLKEIFPWVDNKTKFGTEYHPKDVAFKKQLNPNNVIFLPDLHSPFIKEGVLEFCKEQQEKYDCGTVIFAGDIVDGHAWSYHEKDVDGMSVGAELSAAKIQLEQWFKAFPKAISLMGNHDLLIQRKAKTIGLSKHFIKGFGDVLNAPKTWEFKLEHTFHNVLYKHGNIGDAFKVAKESRISTCQGHFHAKTFVQWSVSEKDSIFGLQVGWAADRHEYAFDYGKSFTNKPIISCGLILDRGQTPIVKLMNL